MRMVTIEGPFNLHKERSFEKTVTIGSFQIKTRNMTFHERTSSSLA
jgi:hypothetical protein